MSSQDDQDKTPKPATSGAIVPKRFPTLQSFQISPTPRPTFGRAAASSSEIPLIEDTLMEELSPDELSASTEGQHSGSEGTTRFSGYQRWEPKSLGKKPIRSERAGSTATEQMESLVKEMKKQRQWLTKHMKSQEVMSAKLEAQEAVIKNQTTALEEQREYIQKQQERLDSGMNALVTTQAQVEYTKNQLDSTKEQVEALIKAAKEEFAAIRSDTTEQDARVGSWTESIRATLQGDIRSQRVEIDKSMEEIRQGFLGLVEDIKATFVKEGEERIKGDTEVQEAWKAQFKELEAASRSQHEKIQQLKRLVVQMDKDLYQDEEVQRSTRQRTAEPRSRSTPPPPPPHFGTSIHVGPLGRRAPSPTPAPDVPRFSGRGPKAPKPKSFTGDKSKADDFLEELDLLFRIEANNYPTERSKILQAVAYLEEEARAWWVSNKERALDDENPLWETYADFLGAFKARYSSPYEHQVASRELSHLRQGSQTMDEYITKCRLLQLKAKVSIRRLWEILTSNINQKVRERIRTVYHFSQPQTEEQAFSWVQEIGVGLEEDAAFDKMLQKDTGNKGQNAPKAGGAKKDNGTNARGTAAGRVTKRRAQRKNAPGHRSNISTPNTQEGTGELDGIARTVIEKRKTENRCMKCGQDGHMFRDCKNAKRITDPKPYKGKSKEADASKKVNVVEVEPMEVSFGPMFPSPSHDFDGDERMSD